MEGLPMMKITRECDTTYEYQKKLRSEEYGVRDYADYMLNRTEIRETDGKNLTLVKVTPEDLGLTENSTGRQILEAAKKKGLKLCPLWVGPQYRLDCNDSEYAFIGMEPVVPGPEDDPGLFYIYYAAGVRWLHWVDDDDVHDSGGEGVKWVFVFPE